MFGDGFRRNNSNIFSRVRSPWAHVLLVRYAATALKEGVAADSAKALQSYLTNCLDRPHADMVMLEAARAVCTLPMFTPQNVNSAITALQPLLSSHRPSVRFAAVRTLNQVGVIILCITVLII